MLDCELLIEENKGRRRMKTEWSPAAKKRQRRESSVDEPDYIDLT